MMECVSGMALGCKETERGEGEKNTLNKTVCFNCVVNYSNSKPHGHTHREP